MPKNDDYHRRHLFAEAIKNQLPLLDIPQLQLVLRLASRLATDVLASRLATDVEVSSTLGI